MLCQTPNTDSNVEMERHERLNDLKRGFMDDEIEKKLAGGYTQFTSLLLRMISSEASLRPSCQDVRECIRALLNGSELQNSG